MSLSSSHKFYKEIIFQPRLLISVKGMWKTMTS
jgi:hypothetical protein